MGFVSDIIGGAVDFVGDVVGGIDLGTVGAAVGSTFGPVGTAVGGTLGGIAEGVIGGGGESIGTSVGQGISSLFEGGTVTSLAEGASAAQAAERVARIQADAAERSRLSQVEALATSRADLAPFREAGVESLTGLTSLITDPTAQRRFIQENPFFDALAERSTQTLLANKAAKGKVGSGGTAEALQNSLLLIGSNLLNQNIAQRQNLVNVGQASAAGQATATQTAAPNIASSIINRGDVQAAGVAEKAATRSSLLNLCDIRMKENIERVGHLDNGIPLYKFNYLNDNTPHINVMAQEVEMYHPVAVVEIDGIKYVDMNEVVSYGN